MIKFSIRKEISPFNTLQLASLEVENWRIAKQKEYEAKAADLAKKKNDDFAMGAYEDQKAEIQKDIFQNLN